MNSSLQFFARIYFESSNDFYAKSQLPNGALFHYLGYDLFHS